MKYPKSVKVRFAGGGTLNVHGIDALAERRHQGIAFFVRAGNNFPMAWCTHCREDGANSATTLRKTGWYLFLPEIGEPLERTDIAFDQERLALPSGA